MLVLLVVHQMADTAHLRVGFERLEPRFAAHRIVERHPDDECCDPVVFRAQFTQQLGVGVAAHTLDENDPLDVVRGEERLQVGRPEATRDRRVRWTQPRQRDAGGVPQMDVRVDRGSHPIFRGVQRLFGNHLGLKLATTSDLLAAKSDRQSP